MTALVSFLVWLWKGRPTGRHHNTSGPSFIETEDNPRQGRDYIRADYRWLSPTKLMRMVRERDLHTATRPMRWWEQDGDTPDLRPVLMRALDGAGTWVWNTTGDVGMFTWKEAS
jgi:hypothetical protein